MNRRAGATDRHTLLSGGAYPSSSRSSPAPGNPYGSSPYSNGNPYVNDTSNQYAEYGNQQGALKKEPGDAAGARPGGFLGRMAAYASQRTAEDLEEQNDERLEGLSARVQMLKDITTGIGNEVRDSTKDMGALGEAFSNTSAFLGGTMTRMNRMAKRQGSWFCNMMLFLLLVTWIFIFLWWWRR